MNIVFRTDASQTIGTGHVMRCITLANALRYKKADVLFICHEYNGHLCDLIEENNFSVIRLPVSNLVEHDEGKIYHASPLAAAWEEDAERTRSVIKELGKKPDWLIVDNYSLDRHWENSMRKLVKHIMVIDDLADREHDCDLLLDQN